jgi:hypothetical protein
LRLEGQAREKGLTGPKFVYTGLTTAMVGGWLIGSLLWSGLLPSRAVAAAETAAEGRPYCIDVNGRPARSASDLTGMVMRTPAHQGLYWRFHALLTLETASGRTYMNWSYRSGRFEPVSESGRKALHLDREARCRPAPHFARDWV